MSFHHSMTWLKFWLGFLGFLVDYSSPNQGPIEAQRKPTYLQNPTKKTKENTPIQTRLCRKKKIIVLYFKCKVFFFEVWSSSILLANVFVTRWFPSKHKKGIKKNMIHLNCNWILLLVCVSKLFPYKSQKLQRILTFYIKLLVAHKRMLC